jgi:phosphoglycolate phosphatase
MRGEINIMKYKYILLDMDGTICDSGRGIINSITYALDSLGIEIPDLTDFKQFLGPPIRDSFRKHFSHLDGDKIEEVVAKYRERYVPIGMYENDLYPGISELIKDLKADGRTIILATGKVQDTAEDILKHFDLMQYFDLTAGCELDGTRSYKHEIIHYALEKLGALHEKKSAVMIGDRHYDITGAAKTGITSVGVLYGYGTREELAEHGADYIAESVADLRKLLGTC